MKTMKTIKKFFYSLLSLKSRKSIFPAFFLSGSLTLLFGLFASHHISSFDRIISLATASNYDVKKLTFNIILFIIIFVLLFCASYLFFNYLQKLRSKSPEYDAFWQFFTRFSLVASVALGVVIISFPFAKEYGRTSIITPALRLLVISFAALTSYALFNLKNKIKFDTFCKLIIFLLIASFAFCVAFPKFLPYINYVQIVACIASVIILKIFKISQKFLSSVISGFVITFSTFLIFLSIYIETLNILNQHEVFITNPLFIFRIFLAIVIFIAAIISFILYKKSNDFSNWKRFVYPTIVIGVLMLSVQLPLVSTGFTHLMESANYSVLISDFLNFGKIPLVEHYGGHMLTQFFGGVFYGILNNDFSGAIYSPYAIYMQVILSVIFYFLAAKIVNRDIAFLSVIFLPFLMSNFDYSGLGVIIIFSLLAYFKKPSILKALVVDFCILICVLYRLDLGVAFGISAAAGAIIYAIFKKRPLKKLILTSTVFAIAILILWFILCSLKNLDPINQLKQFLVISASNQNWAFPTLHKSSSFVFAWAYIVLPLIMLSSLLYLIFSKFKNHLDSKLWFILLVLGIAYLANFTRGIVRHNVTGLPDNAHTIFWTAYLYLAIYFSAIMKNPAYFIPSYIAFTLGNFVIIGSTFLTINLNSPINTVTDNLNFTSLDRKVNRITINETTQSELDTIVDFISPFLNSDETFLDYTNVSLIYSYMKKPDPIYAAQTPGHLNGDFSQTAAIKDLESSNVKLALMPSVDDLGLQKSLDGIPNSLRYYKLSEYIYQNYTPLLSFKYGEIWIKNGSLAEAKPIAKNLCREYTPCHVLSSNTKPAEAYNLGLIPLLWGENDSRSAANNSIVSTPTATNDFYVFDTDFNKEAGNYVKLITTADAAEPAELTLGNLKDSTFTKTAVYNFTLQPGEHTYLFRISHDEDWYNQNVNTVKFTKPNSAITILEGD